jgi:hypothetical protein
MMFYVLCVKFKNNFNEKIIFMILLEVEKMVLSSRKVKYTWYSTQNSVKLTLQIEC